VSEVVGIDYLPAVAHAPGVGRYARELVRALAPLDDRPTLRLFEVGGGPRAMEEQDLGLAGAQRLSRVTRRWPRRAVSALGRLGFGADRWLGGVDLFHRVLPGYPPVARAREVQPVAELPPAGSPADAELGAACRRAAAVVVFSEHYRTLVPARYDLDRARVHLTPVGCEHWARRLAEVPPPPARPRLLVLGALRGARQPETVLSAFEALRDGGVDAELVLVGHPGDAADGFRSALAGSAHAAAVTWESSPREADMPSTAAGATLLLHLAEDEGSPVTPLEAFRFGRAVVASDLPAFREALGEEGRYVAPDAAPHAIADELAACLAADDEAARKRRVTLASGFTWTATATATVAVWRELFEAGKKHPA
jgi:glycosyltransferase involved in cell wall biosynthesis